VSPMLHWELEDAIGAQLTSRAAAYSVNQGGPFVWQCLGPRSLNLVSILDLSDSHGGIRWGF